MNRWVALLCFSLTASAADSTKSDAIQFRNGDLLYGALNSISSTSNIQWQHPDSRQPLEFKPDAVTRIDFAEPSRSLSTNRVKVVLANGDLLNGDLGGLDLTSLTLDTWYAGRLQLARKYVSALVVVPRAPAVFDGISGLEGWTQGQSVAAFGGESGQWAYRNGALYADKAASIARDLKLPDVARIEFDLAWKNGPNIAIALYTDYLQPILLANKDAGPEFGGFYSFRLTAGTADLLPIKKRDPLVSLGSTPVPIFGQKTHAHFDLRISKPRNRVLLFVDGALVKEWVDPNGFAGQGTGVRFVQNAGGAVKLSGLRVSHWDGILDEQPTTPPPATQDVVWQQSGKMMAGTITDLNNNAVTMRWNDKIETLPLDQVREIDFKMSKSEAMGENNSVRAVFATGGVLHVKLENWTTNTATLQGMAFGAARFNPAAFGSLQFSPE